jgi:hypothetical protein
MRMPMRWIVVVSLALAMLAMAGPALAQDESLGGSLFQRVEDEREPVEGVVVVVIVSIPATDPGIDEHCQELSVLDNCRIVCRGNR